MSLYYEDESKGGSCVPCKPEDRKTLKDLLKPVEYEDVKLKYEISGPDKENFYISEEGKLLFTPFPDLKVEKDYKITIKVSNGYSD